MFPLARKTGEVESGTPPSFIKVGGDAPPEALDRCLFGACTWRQQLQRTMLSPFRGAGGAGAGAALAF